MSAEHPRSMTNRVALRFMQAKSPISFKQVPKLMTDARKGLERVERLSKQYENIHSYRNWKKLQSDPKEKAKVKEVAEKIYLEYLRLWDMLLGVVPFAQSVAGGPYLKVLMHGQASFLKGVADAERLLTGGKEGMLEPDKSFLHRMEKPIDTVYLSLDSLLSNLYGIIHVEGMAGHKLK